MSEASNSGTLRRFFGRVLAGMGDLADFAPGEMSSFDRRRTAAEALRGDWERVGGDMRRVIERARRDRPSP